MPARFLTRHLGVPAHGCFNARAAAPADNIRWQTGGVSRVAVAVMLTDSGPHVEVTPAFKA
jgi:hypothetical protein